MEFVKVKELNEEILREIVSLIVSEVKPSMIILFGSHARGKANKESDLDLLIVMDSIKTSRREIRLKIRKALRKFIIPKDIIVVTTRDVEEWKDVPQAFVTSIIKKGRILYGR